MPTPTLIPHPPKRLPRIESDRDFLRRAGISPIAEKTTAEEEMRRREFLQAERPAQGGKANDEMPAGDTEKDLPGRIGAAEGFLMMSVALAIDLAQFLLSLILVGFIANSVISICAWLTFFLWFKMKGINFGFSLGRRGGSMLRNPLVLIASAAGVEFIPIINNLPAWSTAVGITLALQRKGVTLPVVGGRTS